MLSTPKRGQIMKEEEKEELIFRKLVEIQGLITGTEPMGSEKEASRPTPTVPMVDEKADIWQNAPNMESTPKRARVEPKEETSASKKSPPFKTLTIEAVPTGFEVQDSEPDTFEIVPGRLTMAAEQTHYRVTTEEMRRRIEGVEQINVSNLACNLKRTKDNGGGERLRNELKAKGIEVVRNKRQHSFTSNSFVALTEAEAVHLARDLEEICEEIYPATEIAKEVLEEAGDITKDESQHFQFVMKSLANVFASAVPPISGIRPKPSMSRVLNQGMEELSQGTHGFGIVSQPNWIRQVSLIASEMEAHMEEQEKDEKKEETKEEK